nr:MAG TPA: hypothetical protein [Caudoviricetes sp.]
MELEYTPLIYKNERWCKMSHKITKEEFETEL